MVAAQVKLSLVVLVTRNVTVDSLLVASGTLYVSALVAFVDEPGLTVTIAMPTVLRSVDELCTPWPQ